MKAEQDGRVIIQEVRGGGAGAGGRAFVYNIFVDRVPFLLLWVAMSVTLGFGMGYLYAAVH